MAAATPGRRPHRGPFVWGPFGGACHALDARGRSPCAHGAGGGRHAAGCPTGSTFVGRAAAALVRAACGRAAKAWQPVLRFALLLCLLWRTLWSCIAMAQAARPWGEGRGELGGAGRGGDVEEGREGRRAAEGARGRGIAGQKGMGEAGVVGFVGFVGLLESWGPWGSWCRLTAA